jgi:hypothetical protein
MPTEAVGDADVGLLQSFFKEFANWHGLCNLPSSIETLLGCGN